jgi:hypothetical protein
VNLRDIVVCVVNGTMGNTARMKTVSHIMLISPLQVYDLTNIKHFSC